MNLDDYQPKEFYDELIGKGGRPRVASRAACDLAALVAGITFRVYFEDTGVDRAMPFDLIPRVIALKEWQGIEAGLKQRVKALNCFIDDLYNDQEIIRDG